MRRTVSTGSPRLPRARVATGGGDRSALVADPLEELVEERHRERGVSVRGAVDDAFRDQRRTARRHRLDADAEGSRNLPRAMRPGTQRCHRDEVLSLTRREAVEPHEKEVLVKLVSNSRRSAVDVIGGDRALWRHVPDVVAPLLEEVRISVRTLDHDV